MPEEKSVIDLKQELLAEPKAGPSTPAPKSEAPKPELPKRRKEFRFKKIDCPGQAVKLPYSGKKIVFRVPRAANHGGFNTVGYFETFDENEAEELREDGKRFGVYELPIAFV